MSVVPNRLTPPDDEPVAASVAGVRFRRLALDGAGAPAEVHHGWASLEASLSGRVPHWVDVEPLATDTGELEWTALVGRLGMASDGRTGTAASLLRAHEFARVTYDGPAVTRIDLAVSEEAAPGDEPPLRLVMNDRSVATRHVERVAGATVAELATGGEPLRPWTVALGLLESVLHRHHGRLQHIQATLAGLDPLDHRSMRHRALLDAVGRVRRDLLQLYRRASGLHLVATRLEVCRRAEWPAESQPAREALREQATSLLERIEATRADAAFAAEMHVARQEMDSNEAMKWLTVVSTAALPLGLVTAYFGMNFSREFMPELDSGAWLRGLRWGGLAWFVLVVGVAVARSLFGTFSLRPLWRRRKGRRPRR